MDAKFDEFYKGSPSINDKLASLVYPITPSEFETRLELAQVQAEVYTNDTFFEKLGLQPITKYDSARKGVSSWIRGVIRDFIDKCQTNDTYDRIRSEVFRPAVTAEFWEVVNYYRWGFDIATGKDYWDNRPDLYVVMANELDEPFDLEFYTQVRSWVLKARVEVTERLLEKVSGTDAGQFSVACLKTDLATYKASIASD